MRLSYKNVFSRYRTSISDHLARFAYSIYKKIKILLSRFIPLKEYERQLFNDKSFWEESSSVMPSGFNFLENKVEPGYLQLKYIDFFDYLPKEQLETFEKEYDAFVRKNKLSRFSSFRSQRDRQRLESFGRYIDGQYFSSFPVVEVIRNKNLKKDCSSVAISLRNLSPSFLVIQYRFYLSEVFNQNVESICRNDYEPYSDISRQFNVPWFKPKQFGRSYYTGDNAREKALYELISKVKWNAFKELRRTFTIHFEHDRLFPPTFQSFFTNIRPDNNNETQGFWNSVMLKSPIDYAAKYNTCVCWKYDCSKNEGTVLSSYNGGKYNKSDTFSEIAQYHLADMYAVYLTASSLRRIAERDIAECNKKISRSIRQAKTHSVLKTRVAVERKLYYCYRFIAEFSGETIEQDGAHAFRNDLFDTGSITSRNKERLSDSIKDTKKQIDLILRLLNDAAEYKSSASTMSIQWFMVIITILSLLIAVITLLGYNRNDFSNLWTKILLVLRKLFVHSQ